MWGLLLLRLLLTALDLNAAGRVLLEPGNGRQRLLLSSHGRELEIGAFLAEQERVELSRKLMVLLADFNQLRK